MRSATWARAQNNRKPPDDEKSPSENHDAQKDSEAPSDPFMWCPSNDTRRTNKKGYREQGRKPNEIPEQPWKQRDRRIKNLVTYASMVITHRKAET